MESWAVHVWLKWAWQGIAGLFKPRKATEPANAPRIYINGNNNQVTIGLNDMNKEGE